MAHTTEEYKGMLLGLLPRGIIWRHARDGRIGALFAGLAEELSRLEGDAERALRELDPAQATESLEDWEDELGIPDECGSVGDSIAARRAAIKTKLQRGNLMNCAYYTDLARSLGFDGAAATNIRPLRAEYGRCEEGLYEDTASAVNTFILTLPAGSASEEKRFKPGEGRAGDKLRDWMASQIQCVINRDKPAHIICIFNFE